MKILLTFFILLFSSSILAKDFKGYMCNWHIASVHAKDNCDGTNSWYKVYFPAKFKTKAICMAESDSTFNNPTIMEIFPDYKKPGDEIKAWVAGCDNLWTY